MAADFETLAVGAYSADTAGYVDSGGRADWIAALAGLSAQQIEQRADALALDARDDRAALRRDLGIPPAGSVRILCVGDSITLGIGSSDGTGYRGWLDSLLGRRHLDATFAMCAEGGQTLRHMAPLALAMLPSVKPDIVLINLGVNDAVQPDMVDWPARYAAFITAILASSATVKVAVARINISRRPDLAGPQAAVNPMVDAVVGGFPATRVVAADMSVIHHRWTVDGIHPGNAGYLKMAQQWLTATSKWLP